ncbi:MAG: hypothetical protein CL843_04895 [Crocinitomicaceae bacterium]|nr:hypothetical protein [Crocinitomicaceae bacterium]|tara:strand:+ start:1594 stop:2184 length:591 start_codon:yes stop_codon:yes gene_type:complete
MKKLSIALSGLTLMAAVSCQQAAPKEEPTETQHKETVTEEVEEMVEEAVVDADAVVSAVDQKRNEIETAIKDIEPVSIETTELRSKIKQKWSKIHVYTVDGNVLRIKTYPYEEISKRTEEFYFDKGMLILATIEDNGEGEPGKDKSEIDKMYYYQDGKFVTEEHHTDEKEYSIKDSDGEELLEEAKEYLEIYSNHN